MNKLRLNSTLNDLHPADEFRSPDQIKWRDDLYPRSEPDPVVVQKYADNLEMLPPIKINQHDVIIDGRHRLMACQIQGIDQIPVEVIETQNDSELRRLAIQANNNHGLQLSEIDKKMTAIHLYADGTGQNKRQIAEDLSVSEQTVRSYLAEIDEPLRRVFDLYLQCCPQEEIADRLEMSEQSVESIVESFSSTSDFGESVDFDRDPDFKIPVTSNWNFNEPSDVVNRFVSYEQQIMDNLLYLYTGTLDPVAIPYASDDLTAAVCRFRSRRCYASSLRPWMKMADLIRQPLPDLGDLWSEVALTLIYPSFLSASFGPGSRREEEALFAHFAKVINEIGQKQSQGVIAMLMEPHWNRHVFNLMSAVGLDVKCRVICPKPLTEGNLTDVWLAEIYKDLVCVNQELIIWQV